MFGDEVVKLYVTIGADTRKMEAGFKRAEQKLKGFEKTGGKFGGAMMMGANAAALAVTALAASFTALGIKFNATMEQSEIMFASMIGDAARAKVFFDDLKEMSIKTPFQVTTLSDAAKRMLAYGIPVDEIQRDIKAIGDAMAMLGGGNVGVERVTVALGQMTAKGMAQAQEFRQLAESGVNAWKYLAEYLETDVAGAMKAVESRTVKGVDAVKAVITGMERDFGGGMETLTHTMEGSWGVIKNLSSQIAGEITEPIFEALRDEMDKLANETLPKVLNEIRAEQSRLEEQDAPVYKAVTGKELGWQQEIYFHLNRMAGESYSEFMPDKLRESAKELREEIASLKQLIYSPGEGSTPAWFDRLRAPAAEKYLAERQAELNEVENKIVAVNKVMGETPALWPLQPGDIELLAEANSAMQDMEDSAEAVAAAMQEAVDSSTYWSSSALASGLKLWAGPESDPLVTKMLGKETATEVALDRIAANEDANTKIADDYKDKLEDAIKDAHDAARSRVESILTSPTEVTAFDMFRSTEQGAGLFGNYEDKWDEQARRMRDAMQNPNSPWRNMIPDDILAAGPDATKFYGEDWLDKFYSGQNMGAIDWDAFKRMYDDAKSREDSLNNMIDYGAGIVGVSPEDVRKTLGMQSGEDVANEIFEMFDVTLDEKNPGQMLIAKVDQDIVDNKDQLEEVGKSFWTTIFDSVGKTDQNAQEMLVRAIAPEMANYLQRNGYFD